MTSMAFILGVLPLLFAHGAGAEMRQSLGMAVFSGMLGVTLFGILLTPVFFYVIDSVSESHLFASPMVRRIGGIALGSSRLQLPVAAVALGRRRHPARRRPEPAPRRQASESETEALEFVEQEVRSPRVLALLHRPADLRLGAVDHHHAGRRHQPASPCRWRSIPTSRRRRSRSRPIYPGANAQVVADTVAAPIEQQVNGVENMMYMSSQCTNDGTYTLTVTFKPGVDLNMAQVLVQNRESLAEPILPDLVKRRGVAVKKKSPSILMIVNVFSPDNSRDNLYLSNYATIQLRDELARLDGVGDITYIGQRNYSMRVWLDPAEDVVPQPDLVRRGHGDHRSRTSRSPPASSASRRCPRARRSSSRSRRWAG